MNKYKASALIMAATLLAGCFGGAEDKPSPTPAVPVTAAPTPTAATTVSPANGGEVTLAMRLPKTLNPLLNSDRTVDLVLKLVFEQMVFLDDFQKPAVNTALLESVEYSADGTSVYITARCGAEWSDGTPVSAKDIKFSIDTIRTSPETSVYKSCVGNIFTVTVVNERSVRLNLLQPFGAAPYALCFPLIPEHYYRTAGAANSEKNMSPLGNGLFTFDSFSVTDGMKLTTSEKSLQGKPYISKVSVLVTPSAESDLTSLDQKVLDAMPGGISEWGKYLSSNDFSVQEYLTSYFDFIGFNFDREYCTYDFRRAVAHATPLESIAETIYENEIARAAAPISPSSWLYHGVVTQYAYDIETAKALLPDGEYNIKILVNSENPERVKTAYALRDNLALIGVTAEILELPFTEYQSKLQERDYDIFIGGYSLSIVPDLTFAFHSSLAIVKDGQTPSVSENTDAKTNYFNYQSDTMDMLLYDCFASANEQVYASKVRELQEYIAADLPMVGIGFRKSAIVTTKKIKGDLAPSLSNPYHNFKNWYVNYDTILQTN